MRDIETREDIDALMREFYKRAFEDELIGFIFTDIAKLDLEAHLPFITDFWESTLLGANKYQRHGRNPLKIHAEVNQKMPLTTKHFQRWQEIFRETTDEMFQGTRAELAKSRAESIANRMKNFIRGVPGIESMKRENHAEAPGSQE